LSKRVLAAFLVTLFIVATFATVAEVQAHFTLGEQGTTGPVPLTYGSDETAKYWVAGTAGDHVEGNIAYVNPGFNFKYPIDQLPNYYSPDGAIITDTVGSLWFVINFTEALEEGQAGAPGGDGAAVNITREANAFSGNWLYIAIPPEFEPVGWNPKEGETGWVATSITNNYATIETGVFGGTNAWAPNWWYIRISSWTDDGAVSGLIHTPHTDKGFLYTKGMDPYPDRQMRGGVFDGCYWVWVGGLKAPSCAGRYFFKILYTDPEWPWNPWEKLISFPPQNYPTLVVKGELDPGYISGKLLYCGSYYYGYFYGKPINVSGRVRAEGEAIDPITNEPTGRKVCGVGYFNASAMGFYEIEGLAPGIYTLTAEAEGFPPVTLGTEITVKRGQSIHGVNIYVCPGAKIKLKVNSKCPTGAVDFPGYVVVNGSEGSVGDKLGWYPGYDAPHPVTGEIGDWGYYWVDLTDSEGNWIAKRNGYWDIETSPRSFEVYFGDKTSYKGAEVLWDGHVPDDYAWYISGVPAGVYYVYIRVFGYVQLDEYEVVVPSAQYTGEIYREVDIFKGGVVHATIHFHNQEMPSADEAPLNGGDLIIEAYDAEGKFVAWNATTIPDPPYPENETVTVDVIGDAWDGAFTGPHGLDAGTYTFKVWYPGYAQQEFPMHTVQLCSDNSFSFHLIKGANITVTVYSRDWQSPAQPLYWQHPPSRLRVYFYNSAGDYVGRASGNQVADVDSVDFSFDGMAWSLDDYIVTFWTIDGPLRPSGLPTDVYTIKGFTVGYIQKAVPEVWAQKASSTGDIPLYLYAGARIYITVNFKIEELFAPLPPDAWSYYFRINVKDEEGNLAAANITSVPQAADTGMHDGVTQWTFEVVGFNGFDTPGWENVWTAADPPDMPVETGFVPKWAFGYWEPASNKYTGAGYHKDYGIDAGTYTLEVIEESDAGYVQTATVAVTVSLMGSATVYLDMHRQAYIGGTVWQRNYMGDFRTASWYTVELSGSPASTTATRDGGYHFWAPAGTYTLKVYLAAPDPTDAVVVQERTVVVTWGATASGQDFYLEEGGVPIPEFPAAGVLMLISALAASLYLLRWRKQAIVPMP